MGLKKLLGREAPPGGPDTWANAQSGTCDVCSAKLSTDADSGKRIRNKEFKALVRRGFNPAATGRLGPAGKFKLAKHDGNTAEWYEDWRRTVVEPDKTDWVLCHGCVAAVVDPAEAEARLGGQPQLLTVDDSIELVHQARLAITARVLFELVPRISGLQELQVAGKLKKLSEEERKTLVDYPCWIAATLLKEASGLQDEQQREKAAEAAQAAASRWFADQHGKAARDDLIGYLGGVRMHSIVEGLTEAATRGFVGSLRG